MCKRRVRKAEVNKLSFTDILKYFKEKLENKNLWVTRNWRLVQERKEHNRKKHIMDEFRASTEGSGEGPTPLIAEVIAIFKNLQKP